MGVPDRNEVQELHSQLCVALADVTRIRLLYLLHEHGPNHVTALAEALEVPPSTVSRHLKVLRERGLVSPERQAARVIYRLNDPRVIQALDLLRDLLADILQSRLSRVLASPTSYKEE